MIFDQEEQRKIILELLDSVNIPGKILDTLYAFKQQILQAKVEEKKTEKKE